MNLKSFWKNLAILIGILTLQITHGFCEENFQLKLIIKDFRNNYKGWVKIYFSSCSKNSNCFFSEIDGVDNFFVNPTNETTKYCAAIFSDTDLPFWFFSGKSKTHELEFFDDNFLPLNSKFLLYSNEGKYIVETNNSGETFYITWTSPKMLKKNVSLPVLIGQVLTPGNIRYLIKNMDFKTKSKKVFYLLDKFKLEYKKITIYTTGKTFFNNKGYYRINIDLNIIGKFYFLVDDDFNIVYGEGMGIKVLSE